MNRDRNSQQADLLAVITRLADRQRQLQNFASSDEMTFVLNHARHLVEHDEEGIAFENLTDNLYELGFPLQEQDYETLDRLGKKFDFPESTWAMLRELVSD